MSAKNSLWFQRLLSELKMEAETHPDPIERSKYQHLLLLGQKGEDVIEQLIWEAKNIGVRNPAFPDDLVGWWNDDASYPDDDEEDES